MSVLHIHIHRVRDAFNESDHPRAKNGEFAGVAEGTTIGESAIKAHRKTAKEHAAAGREQAAKLHNEAAEAHKIASSFPAPPLAHFEARNATKLAILGSPRDPRWVSAKQVEAERAAEKKVAIISKQAAIKDYISKLPDSKVDYEALKNSAPEPTTEEAAALSHYTGGGASTINAPLRAGKQPDNDIAGVYTKAIDSYVAKTSLPVATTVYRGLSGSLAENMLNSAQLGTVFVNDGFLSSGIDPYVLSTFRKNHAKGATEEEQAGVKGVGLVINAQKGAHAAPISRFSPVDEGELLFARGSKMVVTKVDKELGFIHVDLLNE